MRVFRFSVAATPDKMRKGKGDERMRCGFRVLVCACPHRRPTRPPPPHVANRGHEPRTHGLLFVLFLVLLPSFSSPAPPPSHLVAQSRSQDERHEIVRDEVDVIHVCHMCVFFIVVYFHVVFSDQGGRIRPVPRLVGGRVRLKTKTARNERKHRLMIDLRYFLHLSRAERVAIYLCVYVTFSSLCIFVSRSQTEALEPDEFQSDSELASGTTSQGTSSINDSSVGFVTSSPFGGRLWGPPRKSSVSFIISF